MTNEIGNVVDETYDTTRFYCILENFHLIDLTSGKLLNMCMSGLHIELVFMLINKFTSFKTL